MANKVRMALLPKDFDGNTVEITPNKIAINRTIDASISSSTELILNFETSFLRVYAIGQDVYLKWGTTACSASNFDEVIPAGQIVDLCVPQQRGTEIRYTSITFIERVASATVVIIEK